jgi:hypothetical protein
MDETTPAPAQEDLVTIDQFAAIKLVVGIIREAERVPNSKKLVRMMVDLGDPKLRQLVAGIAERYQPEALLGRRISSSQLPQADGRRVAGHAASGIGQRDPSCFCDGESLPLWREVGRAEDLGLGIGSGPPYNSSRRPAQRVSGEPQAYAKPDRARARVTTKPQGTKETLDGAATGSHLHLAAPGLPVNLHRTSNTAARDHPVSLCLCGSVPRRTGPVTRLASAPASVYRLRS